MKISPKNIGAIRAVKKKSLSAAGLLLILTCLTMPLYGCGSENTALADKTAATQDTKAVTNASKSFVITDDLGREVAFNKKPERIVVTSASFLEPLHAVGGDVVGRPESKTKMPDFAREKPSIGQVYQIDMEKLLACQPDLVIANKGMHEKILPLLEENNIPVLVLDMKSYAAVKREIEIFADLTGEKDKGQTIIRKMDEKIAAIKKKLPQKKIKIAIIHGTSQGLSVQLKTSIAGSIADMLGWDNVAAGLSPLKNNADAAPYSLETLTVQQPEVIFITSMGKAEEIKKSLDEEMRKNPAWQSLEAVKGGRVYYLPQDLFLLSPGLSYPDAVKEMAKLVYPGAF